MKKENSKSARYRLASVALAFCVITQAVGCGSKEGVTLDEVQQDTAITPALSANDLGVSEMSVAEKIRDNGQPILDYDEFVNGEWKKSQEGNDRKITAIYNETYLEMQDYLKDLIQNTDPDSFSEDDGLYKILTIYHQLSDISDTTERIESMKAYLEKIENVKTLDDLYDLYRDDRYEIVNNILIYTPVPDDGCYIDLCWDPRNLWSGDNYPSKEGDGIIFYKVMEDLGYTEERAEQIANNAIVISDMILECKKQMDTSETFRYRDRKSFEEAGVRVPVFDILGDQYAHFCPDGFDPRIDTIYASEEYITLLNTLYQPENIEMLKDFCIAGAVRYLGMVADSDRYIEIYGDTADQIALKIVKYYAEELLMQEYAEHYLDTATINDHKAVTEEIKQSMRSIIDDAAWLSTHAKEQARSKVLRVREFYGGDTAVNDFSDLILTDNTFDNYISLSVNCSRFYKSQITLVGEDRSIFDSDDYDINAWYYPGYNAMLYSAPWLKFYQDAGSLSEEEKLGFIGAAIAHELGHAYDTFGIEYTSKGVYDPWLSEEEYAVYSENVQRIEEFLDGRETEIGTTIDGEQVLDETIADMLSVECCLRILAEKENPDYDAFFRSYAYRYAMVYTEGAGDIVNEDTHLTGKNRINLILGQFDEFYATYDIDENSPYYIEEDSRLSVF